MSTLMTLNGSTVIYPGKEIKVRYRGKVRDCRIEQIETDKGYIRVFDITSNGYRTFTIKEIGK